MSKEYDFGKELASSLANLPRDQKSDTLRVIFKGYVAKLLEVLMSNSKHKDALEAGMIEEVKKNLIVEFRKAPLENLQMSIKMYEDLFDVAIKEILNEAALAHEGEDSATYDKFKQFEINRDAYVAQGGLFVPDHLRR